MSLVEWATAFFERLNEVSEAQRYLRLWDRCIEFRLLDGPTLHCQVLDGRLRVGYGPAPAGMTTTALQTDSGSLEEMMRGRLTFTETGAGQAGRLRCVGGPSSFPDLSWVGILMRLAQENR